MRVLIFHGYLLRGTGSNVYNASLATALARLGHEVHLLCQERDAALPGVNVHVPDIGGLLPVYVRDRYRGFEVKLFEELSEPELEHYIEANVAAVRRVVSEVGGVDAALANHLVMGPLVLARGLDSRYAVKIHGSALEYTVRPNPRFLPHAREGLAGAAGVLVGSRHTAESLWRTIDDPALPARTRLGPPGVDVELFARRPRERANAQLLEIADGMVTGEAGAFERDAPRAAAALRAFAAHEGPRVLYVGKLIPQKGVDLLLRAWPAVEAAHPNAALLVAGFGEQEDELEAAARGRVSFTGRLEHDEVAPVMAAVDALVVPSVFPESFGMVAAEGAAAGALPVSAGHSGLAEVSAALAARVPGPAAELLSFPLERDPASAIAERLNAWLAMDAGDREPVREALSGAVRELWSWESVAERVLAASAGRLDELPAVPAE